MQNVKSDLINNYRFPADGFIPVASPALVGNERKYVLDCLDTTWISSKGEYIDRFESAFADFCGVKYAISCCNGTVALHLSLLALGVGPGDEVIVPTLTYIASANAVVYCGAKPVFIDSEADTWNLDPGQIEAKITPQTRGIIVVHLYGHPADMDPILEIADRYGLYVLEDAAEAHGALYKGDKVGSIGKISAFSFFGNKIITSGEGGMVCTNDDNLARKVLQLKGQGQDFYRRYWFPIIGYNYRMTNIAAAIGLAQLENVDWHISRRLEVAGWYRERLECIPDIQFSPELPWAKSVYWMNSIVLQNPDCDRDRVMHRMFELGVETRPFFYPMHNMPPYAPVAKGDFPIAERISRTGINLPSSALLDERHVSRVVGSLREALSYR